MKKVYVFFVFLFTLFLLGTNQKADVKADVLNLTITIDEKLPTSFIVNSTAPDFKDYFTVTYMGIEQPITDDQVFIGEFDITKVGEYTITAFVVIETDFALKELVVKVIEKDTEGPVIRVIKNFLPVDELGRTPWDAQESMASLRERFFIYDAVDGYIAPTEEMFEGINKVKLNQFGEVFTINVWAEDSRGNFTIFGDIHLIIIDTFGSVRIETNEDLPLEFIVNTEAPNFKEYFKITDNVTDIEVIDTMIRRGGFDITKPGEYIVSIIYARKYVFDRNRDYSRAAIKFKVIEEDLDAPTFDTYKIDDPDVVNEDGQLLWSYQNMDTEEGKKIADASLEVLMQRFSNVKDNVDGKIEITYTDEDGNIKAKREYFKGIENVRLDQKDTEFIITFEVKDKAGNVASQVIRLLVIDMTAPVYLDFANRHYHINKKIELIEMLNTIDIQDNYDKSESVLKIVINQKDLFEKVKMDYHNLAKYQDRFTEEELAAAANAYRYVLKNGTHTVQLKVFRSDKEDTLLASQEFQIVVENNKIKNLFEIHEQLGIDPENGIVMYYITNFENAKNGEFAIMLNAKDSSGNIAPTRTLRVVIENGPSLATILLVVNAGAIIIFGSAVGIYFLVRSIKRKKKEASVD
ncbi:MAG: hypothetical protein ACOX5X_00275 [Acholeplasmataceae bacterium]|jgi:hypothetical protein